MNAEKALDRAAKLQAQMESEQTLGNEADMVESGASQLSVRELLKLKRPLTPAERRRLVTAPVYTGVFGERTHGQVRGAGHPVNPVDAGPREAVLGRNGHQVGWRYSTTGRA